MTEFADALKAWRERVTPEQAGLPAGAGRRTPGLRREELAALAGISVDYIVRLEQGRATNPSPPLLGALARALRLTDQERDHLYRVAGAAVPTDGLVPRHITPGVQRMMDRLGDVPLAVFTAAWEIVAWNPLWAALNGDPSSYTGIDRFLPWRHFVRRHGAMDYDAEHDEEFSSDLAAELRAATGRYPTDPGLAQLVARLRDASPEFARRWAEVRVSVHRASRKTATGTAAGPITVDCDVLTVPGSDLRIVVYTVVPGSEDASRLDLLRVAGVQALA